MVRTSEPIFFFGLHDFGMTVGGDTPKGIFSAKKSGQFLVRTHVRQNAHISRISRGMSGVLNLVGVRGDFTFPSRC